MLSFISAMFLAFALGATVIIHIYNPDEDLLPAYFFSIVGIALHTFLLIHKGVL
jgi:hypothetical protein